MPPSTDRWAAAGFRPDRSVPTHMARNAWSGADQPAWPSALEAYALVGGLALEADGRKLFFDASLAGRFPDAANPVLGMWGTMPITIDADGVVHVGDAPFATDIRAAIERWR